MLCVNCTPSAAVVLKNDSRIGDAICKKMLAKLLLLRCAKGIPGSLQAKEILQVGRHGFATLLLWTLYMLTPELHPCISLRVLSSAGEVGANTCAVKPRY